MSILTKSKYMLGLQCLKLLWKAEHEGLPKPDANQQAIFDQGYEVQKYAEKLIKGEVEKSVSIDGLYARADIYNGSIYEVKSSTSVKPEHIEDVSFQRYVFRKAGLDVHKVFVVVLNNEFVKNGEIDPKELLKIEEVTEFISDDIIEERIELFKKVIHAEDCATIGISENCDKPYVCAFKEVADLKRECIENSLYGVDIMPSAVDICQLRFWLSLVVDEVDKEKIKPLPNLDNKIMCGNSLLEEFEGVKLFDERLLGEETKRDYIGEIRELQNQWNVLFKTKNSERKGEDIDKELDSISRKINKIRKEAKADKNTRQSTLADSFGETVDRSIETLRQIRKLQKEFFSEFDRSKKENLKKKIIDLEWELIQVTLKEQGNEDSLEKLNSIMKTKSKPFFLWKLNFAEVFQRENPGFDVVIANPPYGANIEKENLKIIKNKILNTKNSNSAAIFIDFAKNQWIRSNGTLSYIVPKSLLYSERWFSLVESMIDNVSVLVDVEKAFERVKLEQVVFVYNSKIKSNSYFGKKFINDRFLHSTIISNKTALDLKAWICGINQKELNIVQKIKGGTIKLSSISETKRGIGVQKYLKEKGNYEVIGGKNIFKFGVQGNKGFISEDIFNLNKKKLSFLKQKKIISQDLIAHIQNPVPHIKIMSYLDESGDYLGLDTVQNTILTNTHYDYKLILALLNSKFVSWYTYKFIYCSAIRTMHFDNYYIGKIIIPKDPNQELIIKLVNRILSITKEKDYLQNPEKQKKVMKLEEEIDQLVYKLYGLTEEEIRVVEEFNNE